MSAVEVIEEIRRLPREEQDEVWSFMIQARDNGADALACVRHAPDAAFERAAEKVFAEHQSLFRRLAQ